MRISDWSSDVCSSDLISDAPNASATSESMTVRSAGAWPAGPVRYQKKIEIARRPRPATSMPVTAPERNDRVNPPCKLVRPASAVGTLARTEMFIPIKPGRPDRQRPSTQHVAQIGPKQHPNNTHTK